MEMFGSQGIIYGTMMQHQVASPFIKSYIITGQNLCITSGVYSEVNGSLAEKSLGGAPSVSPLT